MKSWLRGNKIEMYSKYHEGKSVICERFIRTLKKKVYKYMTSISKKLYVDELDAIVNENKNIDRSTNKTRYFHVKLTII